MTGIPQALNKCLLKAKVLNARDEEIEGEKEEWGKKRKKGREEQRKKSASLTSPPLGFLGSSNGKEPARNAEDPGLIPG